MLGIENLFVFVSTAIILNLYPGPDSMYIIGRSMSQGRLAGMFAAIGISTGSLFHTLIGSIGLSTLIFSTKYGFTILKYIGAAYLFYQAFIMFRDSFKKTSDNKSILVEIKLFQIYKQGAITNILNPKVALFFIALLPQFISSSSEHKTLAFVVLGLIFISTGTLWGLLLAWFSSYFSGRLKSNSKISKWLLRVNAGLFTYLGLKLATSKV